MDEKKMIKVEDLQEKLNLKEKVFILDIRPTEQRQEWKIGESAHIDAYKRLNSGDNAVLDEVEIPQDTTVVTVCAAGRTSLIASEALRQKGINAYSLEGGMKAWNYAWNSAEINFENGLKVIQVRRAAKGCLSYVAGSGGEAIVIDAAVDPEVYIKIAKQNGWKIRYVMDTHIHADYISRTKELAKACGAKHIFFEQANVEFSFAPVKDQQVLEFGNSRIKVLHTPGHTWESSSYLVDEKVVFTGDTLFVDSVGRPDLKADSDEAEKKAKTLYQSVKKLLSLQLFTLVLPAHTSTTVLFDGKLITATLTEIRKNLQIVKLDDEAQFVASTLAKLPLPPAHYEVISGLNRKGSYDGHNPADLEAGGNRCAIGN